MASLRELAKKMDGHGESQYRAYKAIEKQVFQAGAPGKDAERAKIAAELATELHAKTASTKDKKGKDKPGKLVHTIDVRVKLLDLIGYVASDKEVPALDQVMGDQDLREMARFALERNGSPEAIKVMIKALDSQVGPRFRAGLINSIAKCPCGTALETIQKATKDSDRPVAMAAMVALANYADAGSDALLVEAAGSSCRRTKAKANKTRIRLAETLAKSGKKSAAKKIYKSVRDSDADDAQKDAAELALALL